MRVIKSDTGFLYYQKIFKQLMANQCKVVVWQVMPEDGKREITDSRIHAVHFESGKIYFELEHHQAQLNNQLPLYCYAEDGPIIFKTDIESLSNSRMSVNVPPEMKLLEDPEISFVKGSLGQDISSAWKVKRLDVTPVESGPDYLKVKSMSERSSRDQDLLNNEFGPISIDEEEKLYADKRESPRARPKLDKWVKVAKLGGQGPETYKLFDLSRGGMGFLVLNEQEFIKDSEVHVVGFNEFDLDDPLVGMVMSIRPLDETQVEFKVGVKFSEGQD